jgi:signal transduction histidine kinase
MLAMGESMQRGAAPEAPLSAITIERIDAFERSQRSIMSLGLFYFLGLFAIVGSCHPGIGSMFRVDRAIICIAVPLSLAITTLTTAIYYLRGWRSRWYRVCDGLETVATHAMLLVLIYASRGAPLYWFLYLAPIVVQATSPRVGGTTLMTVIVAVIATALAFLVVAGEVEASLMTLLFGAGATFVAATLVGQQKRLAKALEEREELRAALSAVRVEEERARIARDLHDGVAGNLTALTARLDLLRGDLESGNVATLGADLAQVRERSMRGVDDLRSIVWALRHPEGSLSDTISYVRTRCAELCPGDVRLTIDAPSLDPMLDGSLRQHVLRVVQESVRNSLRHGRAGRIDVTFNVDSEFLELTVEDDGVGMPREGDVRRGGLFNIERRARERGGSAEWAPADGGRGTKLMVRFGLASEAVGEVVA